MFGPLKSLDRVLRGDAVRLDEDDNPTIEVPLIGIILSQLALGFVYGLCMSVYALRYHHTEQWERVLATMLKVPCVFLLTLVVTFPSLFAFNALVRSRLTFLTLFKLISASMAVMLAVLASLGPVMAFFSLTTENYAFIVLLNCIFFAAGGALGLVFLLRAVKRLSMTLVATHWNRQRETRRQQVQGEMTPEPESESNGSSSRFDDAPASGYATLVFWLWVVAFGLVGVQMAWIIRPFIGNPAADDTAFTIFREPTSNFFSAFFSVIRTLFS